MFRVTYRSCLSYPELGSDFSVPRLKIASVAQFGTSVVGFGIISISWLKVILESVFRFVYFMLGLT